MTKAFKVRKRKRDTNGGYDYVADFGLINGKRKTLVRKSKSALDKAAKAFLKEHERLGILADKLTPDQLADAVVAISKLNGTTLTDAAEFYCSYNPIINGDGPSITDTLNEMIKDMRRKNRRERSTYSAFSTLAIFADMFIPGTPIKKIKSKGIDSCIRMRSHLSFTTQANDITYLKQLFNFAHKRGYIKDNPTSHLEKPTIERKMPVFMQADDVERFLHYIDEHHHGWIVNFAVLFFAGIRPNELDRMTLLLVSDDCKTIKVDAVMSKTRNARIIDVSDNLAAWIHSKRDTPIFTCIRRDSIRKKACKALNIKWSNDIARKTYATYHLAMYQDAAKTAHQMGHTRGVELLYTNYRGLSTKQESEKFWSIVPTEGSK